MAVYWFSPRQRVISRIVSSIRKVSKNKAARYEHQHRPQSTSHGHIELDMHADTTVLGSNCVILSYTGKSVRFHLTHQSTKLSGTILLSQEPWFGQPLLMVQHIYWFSRVPMDGRQVITGFLTEVWILQGVPPTGGEGETMVTP